MTGTTRLCSLLHAAAAATTLYNGKAFLRLRECAQRVREREKDTERDFIRFLSSLFFSLSSSALQRFINLSFSFSVLLPLLYKLWLEERIINTYTYTRRRYETKCYITLCVILLTLSVFSFAECTFLSLSLTLSFFTSSLTIFKSRRRFVF